MTKEQAQQIADLLNSHNHLSQPITPEQILFTKRKYILEMDKDKVVACVALRKRSWYHYEIQHLCVDPKHRKKGVATKLLINAEKQAKKLGGALLQCTVRKSNKPAWYLLTNSPFDFEYVNSFKSKYSKEEIWILQKII